jgi:hypothetical protein
VHGFANILAGFAAAGFAGSVLTSPCASWTGVIVARVGAGDPVSSLRVGNRTAGTGARRRLRPLKLSMSKNARF